MCKEHYEQPIAEILLLRGMEAFCGSLQDYDVIDDFDWGEDDA